MPKTKDTASLFSQRIFWIGFLLVVGLDQFSKQLALKYLPGRIVFNPGFFKNLGFLILAILVFAVLFLFLFSPSRLNSAGFALIIGGAFSNLLDRLGDGVVVDFITIGVGVLNLADVAIWSGVLLVLYSIVSGRS